MPPTHPKPKGPTQFDLDLLLAARYLYYCHSISIMSDYDYDMAEKEYELVHGQMSKVGSDCADHYPPHVRALGLYFSLSGRVVAFKKLEGMELL